MSKLDGMKVLVTCPPMIGMIDHFRDHFANADVELIIPEFTQVMTEEALEEVLPTVDGWIIGDDPATRRVLTAGKAGKLKACVKWGVGVDNVDFDACSDLGLPVTNTPGVFGREVADIALTYVLGLARETFRIDREIRSDNGWPKPRGLSTWGKKTAIVGYGDIGKQTARRLHALDMDLVVFDPAFDADKSPVPVESRNWQSDSLDDLDFIVFTAPLNDATRHMFNMSTLPRLKKGVRIVNVGRGPLIDEKALLKGLEDETIHSAGLDVFEIEPLAADNPLRKFDRCIFGSHNASNTSDGVRFVTEKAIGYMFGYLEDKQ